MRIAVKFVLTSGESVVELSNGIKLVSPQRMGSMMTTEVKKRGTWNLDRTMILQPAEFKAVVEELTRKSRRSVNTKMNRTIFRLTAGCGLRASEVSKIALKDVLVDMAKPYIKIRASVGKGHKARKVPLYWDGGTLADIREWKALRIAQGAGPDDYFVCSQHKDAFGHRIDRHNLRKRFKACCKVLGAERAAHVTVHHGRHSFISLALHKGKNVVEVQHAAGHASLGTTTKYAHLVDTDDATVGDLFAF